MPEQEDFTPAAVAILRDAFLQIELERLQALEDRLRSTETPVGADDPPPHMKITKSAP